MKIQITKARFRLLESEAYSKNPMITMGNEEQVNFHSSLITHELKQKYQIIEPDTSGPRPEDWEHRYFGN